MLLENSFVAKVYVFSLDILNLLLLGCTLNQIISYTKLKHLLREKTFNNY